MLFVSEKLVLYLFTL